MDFLPRFCPRLDCSSHRPAERSAFRFRHRGSFRRHCDRRVVPRFLCLACSRGFSEQTFRVDYRLKRPELLPRFFVDRVSKVTHRQSSRNHGCSRTTEARHFRRLSSHCEAFHSARLSEVLARGGLGEIFLLDELESYEQHRTEKPVTVPVLIERESGFVVDARVGTLAARRTSKRLGSEVAESTHVRASESRRVVEAAFERLRAFSPSSEPIRVLTDQKASYAALLKKLFGARCEHLRTSSLRRRDVSNPLWPINHTLARLRDNVSRLVRETWGAAKLRRWLAGHLAIWTCYRNYVRGMTNRFARTPPAVALGVLVGRLSVRRLLCWRLFPPEMAQR